MKGKVIAILLSLTLSVSILAGCGNNVVKSTEGTAVTTEAAETMEDNANESEGVVSKVGDENGTHLEMWTFAEVHNQFYANMVEAWNKNNPDKTIEVTFTTYPYDDMHNKLTLAIQSGQGAPDLCDVEISKFPNYMQGDISWFLPMNDYIAPYQKDIIQSRIDAYSKEDICYGMPTHVGATVMYYNDELLSSYGIDYKKIKTWDDYTKAAEALKEASNGEVHMTSVDAGGVDWMWVAMAEYGEDWIDENGVANVQLQSIENMLTMQQNWVNDDLAVVSPDGSIDCEAGFANVADEKVASFPKALWYMSRFTNYMSDMKGKFAIAPCPVFEEGQAHSVGIGGTGTVVLSLAGNENAELSAEFITWAKLSYEGNLKIWEDLGFDPCNTSLWTDETVTKNENNQYIQFFKTNPFDTLNEVKGEINKVSVSAITPTINEQFTKTTLNDILENGKDVKQALKEAQDAISLEQ